MHAKKLPTERARREEMVRIQIAARGVADPRVLRALERVPRHEFVPSELRDRAYDDGPLPIGYGQTISQPYVVAVMTEQLRLRGTERVLEIGTGSGYQTAVLAELCARVFSVEIVPELAESARARLAQLGYGNVEVRQGDGWSGWPEEAPFDGILLAAAPDRVPAPLIAQLAPEGRLIAPLGRGIQELTLVTHAGERLRQEPLLGVRFVPMTGEAEGAP